MPLVRFPAPVEPLWHEWDRKAQKSGLRHTVYAVNGDQYTGEWQDNLKHGKGTQLWKRTGAIYKGDWKFGKRDGYGSYSVPDPVTKEYKKVYTGWWKNDKKCALRELYHLPEPATGKKYSEGGWKTEIPPQPAYAQGFQYENVSRGIHNPVRPPIRAPIQAITARSPGYGTTFYPSGEYYEGEWSAGQRSGWGRMYYKDGSIYEGQWLRDRPCGQGMLRLPNENRYEGGWKDGKKHGPGKFFYLDTGQLFEGVWAADIPKCGTTIDFGRDEAPTPTQYPIPKIELADPDGVLEEAQAMFDDSQK